MPQTGVFRRAVLQLDVRCRDSGGGKQESSTGNQKRVSGASALARCTVTERGNIIPKFA